MFGVNDDALRRLRDAEIDRIVHFRGFGVAMAGKHCHVAMAAIKRRRPSPRCRVNLLEPAKKPAKKKIMQDDRAGHFYYEVAHVVVEWRIAHLIEHTVDRPRIGPQPRWIVNRELSADRCSIDLFLIDDQDNLIMPCQRRKKLGAV